MTKDSYSIKLLLVTGFLFLLSGVSPLYAAKPPPGECSTSELTPSQSCIGSFGAQGNQEGKMFKSDDPTKAPFGLTDWMFAERIMNGDKDDDGNQLPAIRELIIDVGLIVTPMVDGERKLGQWSLRSDIFNLYEDVAIVLKAGDMFSAYLLDETATSGAWSILNASWTSNGLSHLTVYVRNPTAVPVPAAVWLFGSGLLGLLTFSRRKRAV